MKKIENRQNKTILFRAPALFLPMKKSREEIFTDNRLWPTPGGLVLGLVSNVELAARLAQSAKHCRLGIHNFDKSEALLAFAQGKKPVLLVLDWEKCEAEAFKVLNEWGKSADLKSVPVIGYSSSVSRALEQEARRAGCLRVYGKTEFRKELDLLLARYAG